MGRGRRDGEESCFKVRLSRHHRGTGTRHTRRIGHLRAVVRRRHRPPRRKSLLAYPATGKGSGKEEMISVDENR